MQGTEDPAVDHLMVLAENSYRLFGQYDTRSHKIWNSGFQNCTPET